LTICTLSSAFSIRFEWNSLMAWFGTFYVASNVFQMSRMPFPIGVLDGVDGLCCSTVSSCLVRRSFVSSCSFLVSVFRCCGGWHSIVLVSLLFWWLTVGAPWVVVVLVVTICPRWFYHLFVMYHSLNSYLRRACSQIYLFMRGRYFQDCLCH
jgi:hypothetical protein